MQITLDSKSLGTAIKTVKALTGNNNAVIALKKEKKTTVVVCRATGKEVSIEVVLTGTIESGSGLTEFGFDTGVLNGLLRGRKEICLTFGEPEGKKKKVDDSQVFFESKANNNRKYNGNFMAVPGEEITFKEEDSENDLELDNAMQTAISDAVSKVGITDIFEGNELDLWVVADKKGLRTAVFDDYHISLCEYGDMKFSTKLEFNLPFSTFTTINDLSDGEAYDIVVGSSTIRAHNDFFRIVMPLLQDNDREQTIEDVIGLCTSLSPKKSDASFTIGQDDLDITLDNINSVHEEGVGCELIFGKDDVHFHLKTGFGEVNDYPPVEKVKGKKGSTLILNQHLLSDCLNAYSSKGKIDFHVKDENIIWCQDATEKYTATYVTLLLN